MMMIMRMVRRRWNSLVILVDSVLVFLLLLAELQHAHDLLDADDHAFVALLIQAGLFHRQHLRDLPAPRHALVQLIAMFRGFFRHAVMASSLSTREAEKIASASRAMATFSSSSGNTSLAHDGDG